MLSYIRYNISTHAYQGADCVGRYICRWNEMEKRRHYDERVREVEHQFRGGVALLIVL